jgi:thiamine biosynthesis lipoprotein ApbE
VIAIGAPPEAEGWTVAIELPFQDGEEKGDPLTPAEARPVAHPLASSGDENVVALVELRDEALSVSANSGKFFIREGKRFGHVIDPRTGIPVEGTDLAAVVTASATESDAFSTALLTLGRAGHARIAGLREGMRTLVLSLAEPGDAPARWRAEATGIEVRTIKAVHFASKTRT